MKALVDRAMPSKITLVTPTGDRPDAFRICLAFMKRQTFPDWHWVVVDDGRNSVQQLLDFHGEFCTGRLTYIRPNPIWFGLNTQKRNLLAALPECKSEWIAFIEDDDWYHPQYLERMLAKAAEGHSIVGEARAKYYHLPSSSYRLMDNREYASLAQTVMHRDVLIAFKDTLMAHDDLFDVMLWRRLRHEGKFHLFPKSTHVVGIKGMPGRPGIGVGHRPGLGWHKDPDCKILKQLIGPDIALYRDFLGSRVSQPSDG
jgi:glycosyltransferase involved in cell wall biosynthesis